VEHEPPPERRDPRKELVADEMLHRLPRPPGSRRTSMEALRHGRSRAPAGEAERVAVVVLRARQRDGAVGTPPQVGPSRINERQRSLEREDTLGHVLGGGKLRELDLASDDEVAEAMPNT
jgi:hypothetical protein